MPPPVEPGFTLVELLVVVAVLAILASLLFPALSQGKRAAVAMKCRSNLHQLGVGLGIYVDDTGVYPSMDLNWWDVMSQLVGLPARDRGVLRCPSRPGTSTIAPDGTRIYPQPKPYGYNALGYRNASNASPERNLGLGGEVKSAGTPARCLREAEVLVPADMLAIGDALMLLPAPLSPVKKDSVMVAGDEMLRVERMSFNGGSPSLNAASMAEAAARHENRGNVTFCDGHTAALTFRQLFLDPSDESLCRWNNDHQPHRAP